MIKKSRKEKEEEEEENNRRKKKSTVHFFSPDENGLGSCVRRMREGGKDAVPHLPQAQDIRGQLFLHTGAQECMCEMMKRVEERGKKGGKESGNVVGGRVWS